MIARRKLAQLSLCCVSDFLPRLVFVCENWIANIAFEFLFVEMSRVELCALLRVCVCIALLCSASNCIALHRCVGFDARLYRQRFAQRVAVPFRRSFRRCLRLRCSQVATRVCP